MNTRAFVSIRTLLASALLAVAAYGVAQAPPVRPGPTGGQLYKEAVAKMGLDQKLGDTVEKDAEVVTEYGEKIKFGDLLGKRPILLVPIFYTCKSACGLTADSVLKNLVKVESLNAGQQYDVVFLSINPTETPEIALAKKKSLLMIYDRPGADKGFHFLTGTFENVNRIAQSVGFRYVWNEATKQVFHPTGIMVLTKDGLISRYFYGTDYPGQQLKVAFQTASYGKQGPRSEPILMGCIMVDPVTGQRSLNIMRTLQVLGGATVLIVLISILTMSLKYRTPANPVKPDGGADRGA